MDSNDLAGSGPESWALMPCIAQAVRDHKRCESSYDLLALLVSGYRSICGLSRCVSVTLRVLGTLMRTATTQLGAEQTLLRSVHSGAHTPHYMRGPVIH